MNPITVLILLILALGVLFVYRRLPAAQRGAFRLRALIALALFGLAFLALTHRLYLLGALFALLVPFLRHLLPWLIRSLPFLARWYQRRQQRRGPSGGQRSKVAADIVAMELDHDTGAMTGQVLSGPFAGRDLADLQQQEFIELLQYCRQTDTDSARLLESYLDKRFGDSWRADDPNGHSDDHTPPSDNGSLSDAEAYDILGLEPGADRDAIVQAHRRLMQKLHPDHGGSAYLAARINAARAHLLASK
ncbi:DnaJ domain-containing protein [Saccharospirillum mangrovi]|uniref:DnaJ domain-containing protein n=1 Tax=Saccharospirillum mangrovi TaxID=2161747 RepID=UPI000D3859A9|nr:DnaJ domain-containing protein [Saccharospirillum mangrovi]